MFQTGPTIFFIFILYLFYIYFIYLFNYSFFLFFGLSEDFPCHFDLLVWRFFYTAQTLQSPCRTLHGYRKYLGVTVLDSSSTLTKIRYSGMSALGFAMGRVYPNSPLFASPSHSSFLFFLSTPRPTRYGDSLAIGSHYEIAKLNYVKQCGYPSPSGYKWISSEFVDLPVPY